MGKLSCSALIFLFLLTGQWASGQGLEAAISSGFQSLNLHWSIAGNSAGQSPNIYSELRWVGVGGVAVDGSLRYRAGGRWVFFGEGSRVITSTGRVSDKDYAGDNRTGTIYNEDFAGRNGYSYSLAAGAGYSVRFGESFDFIPALGYAVTGQHLTITDPGGYFDFLNSYYATSWYGPFVRAGIVWRGSRRWSVSGQVAYHQVSYRAKADWNLIADFSHPVSFRHRADGFGGEGELNLAYRVCRRVEIFVAMNGNVWETGAGIDALYKSSGPAQQTQLNEVVMAGFGLRAGGRWRF